jgi:hypothetical protein
MRGYTRSVLIATLAAVLMGLLATTAGAVVLRSQSGQFFGAAMRQGVSPASAPGVQVPAPAPGLHAKSNGNVDYNGGPVLHSTAPYLIFWDPSGKIPAASRTVMSKYLADTAADSRKSTNVYSVLRQYTDTTGFADYKQAFKSTQAILDKQAYPTTHRCPTTAPAYPICITDAQVHAELTRLIAADKLPRGLAANAPMYAVITPQNVNECFDAAGSACGSNFFCAYHSNYVDGGQQVLYSIDPFIVWALDPTKGCQTDGTAKYQSPNAQGDHAYQINDNLSHEMSETITDPLGTGWWNTYQNNGQEVGDICATYGKPSAPLNGISQLAYAPTLGGTESAGNLFDQIIKGDKYYNQTEWSNGDVNCKAQNTAGTLVASFTATGSLHAGSSISFNPAASSNTHGYSSTTWSFGDGKGSFSRVAPVKVTHAFAKAGTYRVVLTLVDSVGNVKQFAKTLTIAS